MPKEVIKPAIKLLRVCSKSIFPIRIPPHANKTTEKGAKNEYILSDALRKAQIIVTPIKSNIIPLEITDKPTNQYW